MEAYCRIRGPLGPQRDDLRAALGAWATVAVAPSKRRRRQKLDAFLFDFDRGERTDPELDDEDDGDDEQDDRAEDGAGYSASYL